MGLSFVWFEQLAAVGYMGVDVFFVISGLVIAKSMDKIEPGFDNGKRFISKRLARIYFGYWPIFLLSFVIFYWVAPADLFSYNLIESFFLLDIYGEKALIVTAWSLPYELYFYSLMGLLLIFNVSKVNTVFAVLLTLVLIKVNVVDYRQNKFLDLIFTPMLVEFCWDFICGVTDTG